MRPVLYLFVVILAMAGCTDLELNSVVEGNGHKTDLTVNIHNGTNSKGIEIIPVNVVSAVFTLTDPSGYTQSFLWKQGDSETFTLKTERFGNHVFSYIDIDELGYTNSFSTNFEMRVGFNYTITVQLGGWIVITNSSSSSVSSESSSSVSSSVSSSASSSSSSSSSSSFSSSVSSSSSAPLPNTWTWMSGTSNSQTPGIYGIRGVGAHSNMPGLRMDGVTWTDSSGNFWLFGGYGNDSTSFNGYLNDLWKYERISGNWIWIAGPKFSNQGGVYGSKGVPSAANNPGGRRGPVTWIDNEGKLWLFGGYGYVSATETGKMNDLWKFDPSTGMWTWISGANRTNQAGIYGVKGTPFPDNVPGARNAGIGWTDNSGNLWLFGGCGCDSDGNQADLSDIWIFDTHTKNWTWVAGSNKTVTNGTYGTRGNPSPDNIPGSRSGMAGFKDSSGNFWMFGGMGRDGLGKGGYLNDLWKFDMLTFEWTWVSGSSNREVAGIYGTRGTGSTGNMPGSRDSAIKWGDNAGNLWLFGGFGLNGEGSIGWMNDLWKFNIATGIWTWVSGSERYPSVIVYGKKGISDPTNVPGPRYCGMSWTDPDNNLWLFGGTGYDTRERLTEMNDMWIYRP